MVIMPYPVIASTIAPLASRECGEIGNRGKPFSRRLIALVVEWSIDNVSVAVACFLMDYV